MENESGFTPTGDMVLVKPIAVEQYTAGGLAIPQMAQERHQKAVRVGTVLCFGAEASESARMKGIGVGDMVLFAKYASDEFPVKGTVYFVMRATSVMGKVTKLPDYELGGAKSSLEAFGANEPAVA